MEEKESEIF